MSIRHGDCRVRCLFAGGQVLAQQAAPPGLPPLFFREEWKQIDRPANAPADFVPEGGVTPAAVTNANLELRLYDPNAKSVPAYLKQPPTGSIARDWGGPSCIQLAGYNQNPPPAERRGGAAHRSAESLDRRLPDAGRGDAARQGQLRRPHRPRAHPLGHSRLRLSRRPAAGEAGGRHVAGRRLRRGRTVQQLDAVSAVRVRDRRTSGGCRSTSRASSRAVSRTWRSRI